MPTYEYACKECGEHLEVVQSFKDDPLTVCPSCQGQLRKVFSAAGLIFKGSGWHIKDYSATARGSASAASGESSGDGAGTTSESTDGKRSDTTGSDGRSETGSKADTGDKASAGGKGTGGSKRSGGSSDSASTAKPATSKSTTSAEKKSA